ncbi:DUF262 domain-containing protein [Nocardioides dubius]|uniref:DUF262 domain-containing protein n=1 Tax=Nocardioides dubius TaxID=317019 RepID=A0ABN1TJL4_9ACTN
MPKEHESLTKVMDEKSFTIADYQRPYAWSDKQLSDLWGDLDLLGSGEHYAGTLVLRRTGVQKVTSAGESLWEHEVVDGQQRLTTISILLGSLLTRLEALDQLGDPDLGEGVDEAKRQIRRLIQINLGGVTEPRLQLGADLASFWRDHVIGDMPAPKKRLAAEQRLLNAAAYFERQIDSLLDPADPALSARRLLDLRRRITSGLKLLVYEVGSTAEVGVIFETLNDRGRSLTTFEKTKNYLLYLASQLTDSRGPKLADRVNERWSGIFTNLAELPADSEDRLLRAHWLATQNADRRSWTGVEAVKKKFPRAKYVPSSQRLETVGATPPTNTDVLWQDLFDHVTDYVDSLWQCSEYLADLEDPNAKYDIWSSDAAVVGEVRRHSHALVRSGVVAQFLPVLFASRLARPNDGESYAAIVQSCEVFSARVFAICGRRAGAGQAALAGAANRLFRGVITPDQAVGEIKKLTWEYAPDDLVRSNFEPTVNWYVRSSHKYVLYEYELSRGKSAGVLDPFTTFIQAFQKTTEHILPQNPAASSDWLTTFADATERANLTDSLGNLVLTMDNSSYGRKEFVDKRGVPDQVSPPCYYRAALLSEREIANSPTWTPASIRDRLSSLREWALTVWPATGPAAAPVALDIDTEIDVN